MALTIIMLLFVVFSSQIVGKSFFVVYTGRTVAAGRPENSEACFVVVNPTQERYWKEALDRHQNNFFQRECANTPT